MGAARALRLLVATLSLASLAWLAVFWMRGQHLIAALGAVALLSAHAWVLAIEFICVWFVSRGDSTPRAAVRQLLSAWWHEVWSDVVVFAWRQPFCFNRVADRLEPPRRRGMVLVHGFFCNRGVFEPCLVELKRRGVPFLAVNLPELFGSIDDCTPSLDQAVSRIHEVTGMPPVVVAHSMGGLVVRAWLSSADADDRVHRVITIGTPHSGTWLARFAFAANARQMRRAGAWLSEMQGREPPSRAKLFTCFYSNCDNIVFPASTATLPGAHNRHLPGLPHVAMVYDASVLAEAIRLLDAPAIGELVGPAATAR